MERRVTCWNVFMVEGEGTRHPGEDSGGHVRERDGQAPDLVAGEPPCRDSGRNDAPAEPAVAGCTRRPAPQEQQAGPVTPVPPGQAELRQSAANQLQLPILFAVVLLAIVIRQLFAHPASMIVLGVCAGLAVLDIVLAVYLLRNMGSTLVVTPGDITFTRRHRPGKGPAPQVIQRTAGSILSFRMAANGPVGIEYTGYALKLRDNATGKEVYAGAFGRRKVQQACQSQGWSFS